MSFLVDYEDYGEAHQATQDHDGYPSEDGSGALRDRTHLFNRHQSTFDLVQHLLCRRN
jgi:hypothetical protein